MGWASSRILHGHHLAQLASASFGLRFAGFEHHVPRWTTRAGRDRRAMPPSPPRPRARGPRPSAAGTDGPAAVCTIWKRCTPAASSTTVVSASGTRCCSRAVARAQRNDVVAAAFDLDRRQRTAARASVGLDAHAVAQVVADDGLQCVGEIGQQHGVREFARRRGPKLAIDGFEDHPVGIDVQAALAAAVGDGQAFRRAVLVLQRAAERALDFDPARAPTVPRRRTTARPGGWPAAPRPVPPPAGRARSDNSRRTRAGRR